MRLWTLHPQYLDSQGLVALWRETLLAQKVLKGKPEVIAITRNYIVSRRTPIHSDASRLICALYAMRQIGADTTLTEQK